MELMLRAHSLAKKTSSPVHLSWRVSDLEVLPIEATRNMGNRTSAVQTLHGILLVVGFPAFLACRTMSSRPGEHHFEAKLGYWRTTPAPFALSTLWIQVEIDVRCELMHFLQLDRKSVLQLELLNRFRLFMVIISPFVIQGPLRFSNSIIEGCTLR